MEEKIKAMLPKEKVCSRFPRDESQCADCCIHNEAIRKVHALVPQIIEKVYEEVKNLIKTNKDPYMFPATEDRFLRDVLSPLSTKK